MKLGRTLERLGAYQMATLCAEEVQEVIRARFPEALFDPLKPWLSSSEAWVLNAYTNDRDGWVVLGLVEDVLHQQLMQRQVAISVVPRPLNEYLDEDIVY